MHKSLKTLQIAIARAVLGFEPPPEEQTQAQRLTELSAELAAAQEEQAQLARARDRMARELLDATGENARILRVSQEYFQVIEDLSDQREQWKEMFFTQSISHQGAQSMLGQALWVTRRQLEITLKALLAFDKPNAEAAIAKLKDLNAPPIGEPMKFAEQMLALAGKAKPQTDGYAERERIAEAAAAAAVITYVGGDDHGQTPISVAEGSTLELGAVCQTKTTEEDNPHV
jgi:hypothetical protein